MGARVLDRHASPRAATTRGCSRSVKVPVLLTHHFRMVDEATGVLIGALSDLQAARVRAAHRAAGGSVEYRSFPTMGHSMHGQDPRLFTDTLARWAATLPR